MTTPQSNLGASHAAIRDELLTNHDAATTFVREQTAAFIATLDQQMHDRFGGWQDTHAVCCCAATIADAVQAYVARTINAAMSGNA